MIAIDMEMPENCVECRLGQGDYGFCYAMPENFCGYIQECGMIIQMMVRNLGAWLMMSLWLRVEIRCLGVR